MGIFDWLFKKGNEDIEKYIKRKKRSTRWNLKDPKIYGFIDLKDSKFLMMMVLEMYVTMILMEMAYLMLLTNVQILLQDLRLMSMDVRFLNFLLTITRLRLLAQHVLAIVMV